MLFRSRRERQGGKRRACCGQFCHSRKDREHVQRAAFPLADSTVSSRRSYPPALTSAASATRTTRSTLAFVPRPSSLLWFAGVPSSPSRNSAPSQMPPVAPRVSFPRRPPTASLTDPTRCLPSPPVKPRPLRLTEGSVGRGEMQVSGEAWLAPRESKRTVNLHRCFVQGHIVLLHTR